MSEYPTLPRPARDERVEALLTGAVDLHCHSGPAVMPRILDHHDQMLEAEAAGFRAVVFKDHFYLGTAHAMMLEKVFPDLKVKLYSGIALNNASGGINPHAVHHAVKLGAKIVWMPTLSAANHIRKTNTEARGFPKVAGAPDPIPLSVLDHNGKLTDDTRHVLDIIAAGDIILSGGHLAIDEQFPLFEEARARGVRKMMVNHPTYLIGCTDEDLRQLVSMGVMIEHSICMFIEGRAQKHDAAHAVHLIDVVGVDNTVFCSDLGLLGSAMPVDGYRTLIGKLLDLQVSEASIRTMFGDNAARLLDLN